LTEIIFSRKPSPRSSLLLGAVRAILGLPR
jgi:hypothetical protein